MMRRLFLIAAMFTVYAFGSQAFATDQKPTPSHSLTDKQKAEYSRLETSEREGQDALQRVVMSALDIPVSPTTSVQFHAQIREIQIKLGSLGAQKAAWLAQARLEANCKTCVVEGDKLVEKK